MNAHDETYGVAIGYNGVALSGRSGRVRCLINMGNGGYLRKSPWMVRMMRRLTLGQNPKFRR